MMSFLRDFARDERGGPEGVIVAVLLVAIGVVLFIAFQTTIVKKTEGQITDIGQKVDAAKVDFENLKPN